MSSGFCEAAVEEDIYSKSVLEFSKGSIYFRNYIMKEYDEGRDPFFTWTQKIKLPFFFFLITNGAKQK